MMENIFKIFFEKGGNVVRNWPSAKMGEMFLESESPEDELPGFRV
jgi:hypothetical protein